jgi:hypothetical protein
LCSCDRLSFRSDIHAPDSVRVNAALSQMQEFSNAFLSEAPGILMRVFGRWLTHTSSASRCPVGSPMNKHLNKCRVW